MTYQQIISKAATKPDTLQLSINNQEKIVKGMALFKSVNMADETYIKIAFNDHSLLVVLQDNTFFYADNPLGEVTTISDDEIGKAKTVTFNNSTYTLDNPNDYQFCLHLLIGQPHQDIEGECRFSDYFSADQTEMLSLGWLSYTGERADVLVKQISSDMVKIVD